MIQLLQKEIQNLKLVIDDCLNDDDVVGESNLQHTIIDNFHNKYVFARGKMNKS